MNLIIIIRTSCAVVSWY